MHCITFCCTDGTQIEHTKIHSIISRAHVYNYSLFIAPDPACMVKSRLKYARELWSPYGSHHLNKLRIENIQRKLLSFIHFK